MEITAEDCSWRVKEQKTPWRKAQVELLSAEDGTTSLQVKRLHEKLGETKILRSAILLQMGSGSDMKNISNLVVHCRPKHHLDFKISMFQKSDIDHVGGELGVAPDVDHNYHLFSKQGMMRMRADQEFKAGMTQRHFAKDGDISRLLIPKETSDYYHCLADSSCGRYYTLNASIPLSSALLRGF
jgi:hypothetical protein